MDALLAGRAAVQIFLRSTTAAHPTDEGLLHYTSHAWEDTRTPAEALGINPSLHFSSSLPSPLSPLSPPLHIFLTVTYSGAFQIVPSLAPDAAHIVHMPGHIYHLLGDHDTAHNSFLASYHSPLFSTRSSYFHFVDLIFYFII